MRAQTLYGITIIKSYNKVHFSRYRYDEKHINILLKTQRRFHSMYERKSRNLKSRKIYKYLHSTHEKLQFQLTSLFQTFKITQK